MKKTNSSSHNTKLEGKGPNNKKNTRKKWGSSEVEEVNPLLGDPKKNSRFNSEEKTSKSQKGVVFTGTKDHGGWGVVWFWVGCGGVGVGVGSGKDERYYLGRKNEGGVRMGGGKNTESREPSGLRDRGGSQCKKKACYGQKGDTRHFLGQVEKE